VQDIRTAPEGPRAVPCTRTGHAEDLRTATGKSAEANVNAVGVIASEAVAEAVVAVVTQADSLAGIPALPELQPGR